MELSNGLILRTVQTEADVDKLAAFNVAVHEEEGLDDLVRDMCSERHPTMSRDDFWLMENPATGEIASSLCLIPQTWRYGDIHLPVARMELVGTAEAYRQQGLFRMLNAVFNQRTTERGINVQVITGISYFYRLMGYEYALDLTGSAQIAFSQLPETPDDTPYTLRRATAGDIPLLRAAYARSTEPFMVAQVRDEAEWRYRVHDHLHGNIGVPHYYMIEKTGDPVGYVSITLDAWEKEWVVDEFSTRESYVNLIPWLVAALRDLGLEANATGERDADRLVFKLGPTHALYQHLTAYNPHQKDAYAWYIRVMDFHRFLQKVRPVLEGRMANSHLRGMTKTLTLRLYTQTIDMVFEDGSLTALNKQPRSLNEGHVSIPPTVFHQLLFGYRSLDEINYIFPDAYAHRWARPVVDVLFPKSRSWATPLN